MPLGLIERIRADFHSRIRNDVRLVRNVALIYHASCVVSCPLALIVDELIHSSEDYAYSEDRERGAVMIMVEWRMKYMTLLGHHVVHVDLVEGEYDLDVIYDNLSNETLTKLKAVDN